MDTPTQKEFIALFPNTRFRYIHDVDKKPIQGTNVLDPSWNQKGYGVFYSVNGFPPNGEAKEQNLLSLNGNYVDFDVFATLPQEEKDRLIQETLMSGIEAGVPTPTIVNRTQKGAHFIWLYPESIKSTPENIAKWREVQKRLVQCFKGDKQAVDPCRVLRLPYTMHLKDPNNPFEIKITSYKPEMKCTLDELDNTVPKYTEEIGESKTPALELLLKGVSVGKGLRHGAMAQVAGLLLKGADTPEKVAIARINYYAWDQKIVGSPERPNERKKELDDTFDEILKREMACGDLSEKLTIARLRLWGVGEILKHDFGEEQWTVESLITKQGITALSGNPGDFKTWVTMHIAICVSRGISVFGKFKTIQGGVLIIDEEDHLRLIKKRLELLGAKDTDTIYYLSQNGIKMDVEQVRDSILELVKANNIKLLILDSLVRVHGQDENDAKGMAKVFSGLQKIIGAGASILFTHHHRKQQGFGQNNPGQMMRGSSDILAAVDCHMTVEKKKDEADILILKQPKSRQGEPLESSEIRILKESFDSEGRACPSGFEYIGGYDEKKKKAEEASEAIIFVLADGMKSRPEIHALIDEFGKSAIDEGIKLAEESGSIERVPKEKLAKKDNRKAYYRIAAEKEDIPLPSEESQNQCFEDWDNLSEPAYEPSG